MAGHRRDFFHGIERELSLLCRHQVLPGNDRCAETLDRSAYLLLSRLEVEQPMSLRELSLAFTLDTSTVNRQVAALLREGLVERIADPDGGLARKIRPTQVGLDRLRHDREHYQAGLKRVMAHWPADDRRTLLELLRRFNTDVESRQGTPWPRPHP